VWSETDLKNFPLKIQTMEGGRTATMVFTAVNLANPDAALFEPSPDYTKYGDRMALMQQEVMKRMGAARGAPPGQP
jgi:hypothetical protein